ncbi:MAG: urease accessory protein UreD [Lachnospiraceae bacterium]|nr:urease accessory protein UreD [Lachnospiraceae bacterium]
MKSRLTLTTEYQFGRTVISDLYVTAPYKVMSPFTSGEHIDIIQMSASAGMLGGDEFNLQLQFNDRSDVTYLSQSYDKVFCSKGKSSRKYVRITVGSHAKVTYMPYPVIPFAGCDFVGTNEIHIDDSASFLYCDVFSCGRVGMNERFQMKRYQSKTQIYIGEQLGFADHTLVDPERFHYQTMGMWGQYTHNGLLYLYVPEDASGNRNLSCMEQIRKTAGETADCLMGVTQSRRGIAVRVLAYSGEMIWKRFEEIAGDFC